MVLIIKDNLSINVANIQWLSTNIIEDTVQIEETFSVLRLIIVIPPVARFDTRVEDIRNACISKCQLDICRGNGRSKFQHGI